MMGRTHSRARGADDVRAQVRRLGVRGGPRPGAPRGGDGGDRDRQDQRPGRDVQPPRARTSRRRSSTDLGLRVDPVSTQIVQRDRHAAFLAAIAILGGSLERLATEVRNLQHTEIAEVMEPFRQGQKGSSAMPHKRNPILSERIAGLARLLRGYAQTGVREPAAVARARHQPQLGGAGRAARRHDPARLHARPRDRAWSTGSWSGRSGCARTSSAASASTPRRGCCSRSSSGAGCRARTRTRSSSATPCAPRTSGCRCTACSSTDPVVAQKLPLAELDACFDDATLLRHVPEVIARLDAPGGRPCGSLRRSSGPARSATCTGSATTGCCSSRRTGCRRSTSSCRRRSRTRAAC